MAYSKVGLSGINYEYVQTVGNTHKKDHGAGSGGRTRSDDGDGCQLKIHQIFISTHT